MTGEELERALARMIQELEGSSEAPRVEALRPVSGGNARSAFSFDLHRHEGDEGLGCILLLQAKAGQLEEDLRLEFRVLELLASDEIPSPAPYWLDKDGRWLGNPGFVMERVPGQGDLRGLLDSEEQDRNRAIALGMAESVARLHQVDWGARNFSALEVPDPSRVALDQVAHWKELFLAHRMEPLPSLVDAFQWLESNAPVAERICVVHGDLRFGNLLYEGAEVTALLDWEMAHLGDPCEDLAWAYHPIWSPAGQLEFEDFIAAYRYACDVPVPDESLLFYRLFGEIKHAVISLTGAHAFDEGGSRNLRLADRMTWVPECLQQFYAWLPEAGAPS